MSTTGSAVRSYLRKTSTAVFLSSVAVEADELAVHHVGDAGVQRGQQDLADPQVVDQPVVGVDDVDDVQRLAVAAVGPDVVEDVPDRPVLADAT